MKTKIATYVKTFHSSWNKNNFQFNQFDDKTRQKRPRYLLRDLINSDVVQTSATDMYHRGEVRER